MNPPLSSPDVDSLLEQTSFVRGLARELVFDRHLARDVEQETLLAALEHAPREAGKLRAWLAAIARNFALRAWRSSARRAQREQACALAEAVVPSPAEILEREDQRRLLVERVLELDEPLRAVLILRYFEELPPREIARCLALPVETVRTRIKRGLAQLRERLDRETGGRAAWCLAFVRGFRLSASLVRLGAALVATSAVEVGLACLTATTLVAYLTISRVAPGLRPQERVSARAEVSGSVGSAAAARTPLVLARPATPTRIVRRWVTPEGGPVPGPQPQANNTAAGSLLLRLSRQDGSPAAEVEAFVYSGAAEDFSDAIEARTDADGICLIEGLPAGKVTVVAREVGDQTIVAGEQAELALTIPLGFHVNGIVVDANGQPVAGAKVVANSSDAGWMEDVVGRSGVDGTFHV